VCEEWRLEGGGWRWERYIMDLRSLQVVRKGLEEGPIAGYEAEAQVRKCLHMRTWGTIGLPSIILHVRISQGFAELGMTSESKALKSLFFGQV